MTTREISINAQVITDREITAIAPKLDKEYFDSPTFTAKMALRGGLPSGLSGAGVMVQGKADGSAGDTLTYSRGTQVVGNFYDHLDGSQFGYAVWVLLEVVPGTGSVQLWLLDDGGFQVYFDTDGTLKVSPDGGTSVASFDASGWSVGKHHIAFACDADNVVGGSDYGRLYVDGVITSVTQITSTWTPQTPGATAYVGSKSDGTKQVQAIIADEVITRNPADIVDNVSTLYNSGNGELAGNVLPAEDMVFYQPASVSAGELATGTGKALTFPARADNELQNWHLQNATAGAPDNWNVQGSPTLADAATGDILFGTRSQKVGVTGTGHGLIQDYSVSPGQNYLLSAWMKSDGLNIASIGVRDMIGSAWILNPGSSPMQVTSTSYTLIQVCFEVPAGCTSVRIFYCYPQSAAAFDMHGAQCQVLPNLVDNGGMEGTYSSGVAPGWTNQGSATVAESSDEHSGSKAQQVTGGSSSQNVKQDVTVTSGKWYAVSGWMKRSSGSGNVVVELSGADSKTINATSSSYERQVHILKASSTTLTIELYCDEGSTVGLFDDISVIELDDVSLTATPASESDSTESGLWINGKDTASQAITALTATDGVIYGKWTPKHSAANGVAFGNSPAYILEAYGDASNYIRVYWSAANTITLAFNDGGGEHSDTWDATGAITGGTAYKLEVVYTATEMKLLIDGVAKITISTAISFGTVPSTIYWGSKQDGTLQSDLKFSV